MLKRESQKHGKKRLLTLLKAELAQPRKAHSVLETEARRKKTKRKRQRQRQGSSLQGSVSPLIVKYDAEKRIVDVQSAVVFDKS
jgi:hypothetical protein